MMRYRDERRGRMQDKDWDTIETGLRDAYAALREAVAEPAAPRSAAAR
jgi:hypothetical protein